MRQKATEAVLAETVERLRAEGDSWWAGSEIAPIAHRRLSTFSRRNKSKHPSQEERALDLIKGLKAHFEPDEPYTHPNDWRALAQALLNAFDEHTERF